MMDESLEMTRRAFVSGTAQRVIALHLSAQVAYAFGNTSSQPVQRPVIVPRFKHLRLQTHQLAKQREFYTRTLGLPLVQESDRSVVVRAGGTLLEFVRAEGESKPFYHFAFNIPENKFANAMKWLKNRVSLLQDSGGRDEIYFDNWDAHATFFHDPSKNIVEFIARHELPNASEGPFTVHDILYASEIGVVAHDQKRTAMAVMQAFGLETYHGSFFFVGDAHGLFVIPPVERLWIPERKQPAAIFPTEITITGDLSRRLKFDELPYQIGEARTPELGD